MRIDSIDTFVCNAYRTNWVFVRIRTDDGLYGWGEATLEYRDLTVKQAVEERAPEIIGKDAHSIPSNRSPSVTTGAR